MSAGEVLGTRELGQSLSPEFSDDWIALSFAERHKFRLRYTAEEKTWHEWKQTHWDQDRTLLGFDLVRDHCRELAAALGDDPKVQALRGHLSTAKIATSVEHLARSDRRLAALPEQWDRDPWLLNTPDGTLDLHTDKIKANDPADFITKITAVAPTAAGSPVPQLWTKFLEGITREDRELELFLQRVYGYALSADVSEEALFFFYGGGFNGKSTFINTIAGAMGSYYRAASMDSFTSHSQPQHPCDVADLAGARMVSAVETSDGVYWDEAKIKMFTGRDPQKGRKMRCNFSTYAPTQKFLIMGNHRPRLRVVDKATEGRLFIVPFLASFPPDSPDRIKNLENQLKPLWPSILRWGIDGSLLWQQRGLDPPKAVQDASAEYFEGEDVLGRWRSECCEMKSSSFTPTHELAIAFKRWTERVNEKSADWSERKFSDELAKVAGLRRDKRWNGIRQERGFVGISLLGGQSDEG